MLKVTINKSRIRKTVLRIPVSKSAPKSHGSETLPIGTVFAYRDSLYEIVLAMLRIRIRDSVLFWPYIRDPDGKNSGSGIRYEQPGLYFRELTGR